MTRTSHRYRTLLLDHADKVDRAQLDRLRATLEDAAVRMNREVRPVLSAEAVAKIQGELVEGLNDVRTLRDPGDAAPLDVLDQIAVRAERIRHVLRDALDYDIPVATMGELVALLKEWLPGVPGMEVARLLGVSDRQRQRLQQSPSPTRSHRRALMVGQLVAMLRHSWTPLGVVAWFDRPRSDLGGATPLARIDDLGYETAVLDAARSGRAQRAS